MRWLKNGLRFLLVTVGIIVLTSFTIDATDALKGSNSALSFLALKATEGQCSEGMVKIDLGENSFCIDQFENSVGSDCAVKSVNSLNDTQENIDDPNCRSISEKDSRPWTFVTYHQAKSICTSKGARLPSPLEWYEAALGTRSDGCNLDGGIAQTNQFPSCQSSRGVNDMVGNVWEWVDANITDAQYVGRSLPPEGYVTDADMAGVAISTSNDSSNLYGDDYFWSETEGVRAMMRGGFYGSGNDGGVYAVHTKVAPSFSSAAIGFRCVEDL